MYRTTPFYQYCTYLKVHYNTYLNICSILLQHRKLFPDRRIDSLEDCGITDVRFYAEQVNACFTHTYMLYVLYCINTIYTFYIHSILYLHKEINCANID